MSKINHEIPLNSSYKNRETLEELYHDEGLSLMEIGSKFDVTDKTIEYWMKKFGIETRTISEARGGVGASFNTGTDGYEYWSTTGSQRHHTIRVHRLLAISEGADPYEVFSGEIYVHHKNRVKWDNRPENIDWMTPSEHHKEHNSDILRGKEKRGLI